MENTENFPTQNIMVIKSVGNFYSLCMSLPIMLSYVKELFIFLNKQKMYPKN
jgi:hypothetical protein